MGPFLARFALFDSVSPQPDSRLPPVASIPMSNGLLALRAKAPGPECNIPELLRRRLAAGDVALKIAKTGLLPAGGGENAQALPSPLPASLVATARQKPAVEDAMLCSV